MITTLHKLAKITSSIVIAVEEQANELILSKNATIEELKEQVRRTQKDIFIRGEKLHLSEQMNKLKEKEATTLRNKITAMAEASERAR